MKKISLIVCFIAAFLSCDRYQEPQFGLEGFEEVNAASEGSVPVRFRLAGVDVGTKGVSSSFLESALANVRLVVEGYPTSGATGDPDYVETVELGTRTNGIVNVQKCNRVKMHVYSGAHDGTQYLQTLEGQKEILYAYGSYDINWSDLQSRTAPVEIEMSRSINKITVNKISVDWANPNYSGMEFRIRKMFLSDVPRTYSSKGAVVSGYPSGYSGTKDPVAFYNFGGLYEHLFEINKVKYEVNSTRLDDQLMEEMDVVVSEEEPYVGSHVFYSYIHNVEGTDVDNAITKDGYAVCQPSATTICLEAELDGSVMYYRFRLLPYQTSAPKNLHMILNELKITEPGSPTLYGGKTYENISFDFAEWTENTMENSSPL